MRLPELRAQAMFAHKFHKLLAAVKFILEIFAERSERGAEQNRFAGNSDR